MTRELALLIYLIAWGGIAWSLCVLVLLAKRELQLAWRRRQIAKLMRELTR